MTLRALILLSTLLVLPWMAMPARAQSCSSGTTATLDFANIAANPTVQTDVTGTLNLTCTGSANQSLKICVFLNAGQDNALSPRVLANGTARLNYQIYSDASRTLVLGPGNNQYYEAQVTLSGGGTATVPIPLYGRVIGGQTGLSSGSYTSTMGGRAVTDTNTGRSCNSGSGISQSIQVTASARIGASCTIVANDLAFPSATGLNANIDGSSTMQVTCTNNLPYNIKLSGGLSGNAAARLMGLQGNAPGIIQYELFRDSGRSQAWGDSTATQSSGTGNGLAQVLTVYGRIPVQATPLAGDYKDTITATVEY